ncbi:hypothetical protein LOTGIDRAFT_134414 [Lottia gigantea]|uniref:Transmembrane protein 43 n=1 Tax=Lottia gigantea TaxID=225164 RepID=V3YWX1_LOTGI|nr:hypothetical protein LOTGIDRAFT_134414 [Lottia gigantea]ESO82553.1 hypothetical protein LOTGIDRAFT_134414 [Lottia gigantea]
MHNNYGNSHTRVTYRRNASFCERIQNSLVAFVVGLGLLVASSGLLYWNEGRAVQTAKSLDEGLSVVIPLKSTDVAFESNNGKLVYLTATLHTDKIMSDPDYGINLHVVKLKRSVEMYQWVEQESKREYDEGGQTRVETSYSYSEEWRSELVSSSSFHSLLGHENPGSMQVTSKVFTADSVQVGNFHLSKNLIDKIKQYKPLGQELINIPPNSGLEFYNGYLYQSNNPRRPQVGDIRIQFEYTGISGKSSLGDPDTVSVVAKQVGLQLTRYETDAGDDLELLYHGEMSAKKMFEEEHNQNIMMTWGIRFAGWLLMFVGFGCLTSIITTLVDWLPIVGELVAMGVGAMNAALSISLSITIIAIGWIRYRPMLGFGLLALSFLPFILSKIRSRGRPSTNYQRDVYS